MKITWVTRSFLDYRVPVYKALDDLCDHQLTVIYNGDVVPERCKLKLHYVLGERAIALSGEKKLLSASQYNVTMANKGFRIPIQKGLIKTIRKSAPDILLSDGFFQWTYASLWVRMFNMRHIKHIMCYEKTPHTERNAGKLRTIYRRFASKWIDGIDCNGSLTGEYIQGILNYRKPLAFGHMVADTFGISNSVKMVKESEIRDIKSHYILNKLTFIYVGRLIPLKGIMQLLKAWSEADLKDASLMLVGDGPQREEIESFVKENNLNDVKLVGAVNYDNLGLYYKVADCFLIPTLEDNWSLVVPEAMAAGLPVACSIYNGCHPELVHSENGWTFDPLNVQDTAHILKKISTNRDKLKTMGEMSRKIVADHTPQHAAKALFDLCRKIVVEKR